MPNQRGQPALGPEAKPGIGGSLAAAQPLPIRPQPGPCPPAARDWLGEVPGWLSQGRRSGR